MTVQQHITTSSSVTVFGHLSLRKQLREVALLTLLNVISLVYSVCVKRLSLSLFLLYIYIVYYSNLVPVVGKKHIAGKTVLKNIK